MAAMSIARYGVHNWGVMYLQLGKGYSLVGAGAVIAISPICELLGSASAGYISDRFFGSRRSLMALLCGLVQSGALVLLYLSPPGNRTLDSIALGFFGVAV